MNDKYRSKEDLINELDYLRKRNLELETCLVENRPAGSPAIGEKEANLQKTDILESISDCFFAFDNDFRLTYVNKAAEKVWSLPRAGLIGQRLEDVFTGLIDISLSKFRQVLEDQIPLHYEIYSKVIQRWGDMSVYPTQEGISLYFRDTTERKQAEEALREREEKYRELVKYARAGIYELDFRSNRFISVNDAMCELSGYTRDEFLKMNPFDLLDDEGKATFRGRREQWLRGEKPEPDIDYRVRTKSGKDVYASVSVQFTRDASGQPLGVAAIGHDVTERRKIEEALRKSEKRFRALVTASSDVVYRMSPDWGEMSQLYGRDLIPDTDGSNSTWIDRFIPSDDQPYVQKIIYESIKNKSIFELEHRVRQADGSLGWSFSRAVPLLDENGEIAEWFGTSSDVTPRKLAEAVAKGANDQLVKKNREVMNERQRLLEVLETLPVMICLISPDYHIKFANKAFRKNFGEAGDRHCYDYYC